MSDYRVSWMIDVSAESAEDAARIARRMQRDPKSLATTFEVAKRCSCGEFHIDDIEEIDLMEKSNAH